MKKIFYLWVMCALVLLTSGCGLFSKEGAYEKGKDKGLYEAIIEAKEKVFPSLVFVKPIQEEYTYGERKKFQVFGSGVIVSADGYAVTNNHVAEKSTQIQCILFTKEEISAEVIGLDPETDLAVLKLDLDELKEQRLKKFLKSKKKKGPIEKLGAKKHARLEEKISLPFAVFGDSDKLKEGGVVLAMGSPFGFERSVSRGIVSCARRYLGDSDTPYNLWIQTDAAINPGNSGGPLVNLAGEIIGINSRKVIWGDNVGFAIPSNMVKEVVYKLIENSKKLKKGKISKIQRSWSGIRFQALKDFSKSAFINASKGVLVASVDEPSPAKRAGLQAGDIIIRCNDKEINGIYNLDIPRIRKFFASLPTGKTARLYVLRGEKGLVLMMTPIRKERPEGKDFDCKRWNMTVKEISKFFDPRIAFYQKKGIYIQGVKAPGNAQDSGLQERDIILKIEGVEIKSLEDIKKVYKESLKRKKGKKKILFEVLRNGYHSYLVLDYEKDYEKLEEEQ